MQKPNFQFYDFIKPAFADKTQHVVIPAGRRVGKTFGGQQWLLLQLMKNSGKRGLWVDTIQSNLSKYIDRYTKPILGDFGKTVHIDNQKYILSFMNGSTLDMVSAERPENMEGFGYDFYVLNEAGIILKNPKLWSQTISPMVKNAQGKIIGTPKGKTANGEIHKYFELSELHLTESNWKTYQFTAYDSPEYTIQELEGIKRTEAGYIWLQEYMAEFIDLYEGSILTPDDLRYYDHVSLDDFTEVYIHADTTHTGKTTSDYFACGVIGMSNKDKNFYLLDFILEKMDVEKQARSCISLYSKYDTKVKKMTYDEKSNQGFGFWIKKLAKEEYNISLPIQDLKYPNDKVTHFEPHVPHFKANRVFLPKNHNRINVLTDQVLAFPTKGVNDDACFVADTKIFTDSGDKNIQNISIGDYVLTRKGFKRVIALSKRKEYVIDNIGLTGTGNHPIITKNGVNCLANISESDILYTLDYNNIPCIEKPSFTIEGNSIDTLSQSIHTYETIFGVTQRANELLRIYIELCGLTIIEKSLKIIISIIKTATLGIMNYQILRGYIKVTILENIGGQKSEGRNQDKQQRKTIELSSSEGKNGLLPKNEKSFLNESLKKISLWEKKKENAIIVKQNLKQFILNKDSAQKYVVNEGGIQKRNEEKTKSGFKNNEKTSYSSKKKSQGTVRYAELDLAQIIQEKNTVAQNAIISHSKEKEWVYNFEVEGEHEYFANGILVHNCDMISGCLDNYNIKKKKVEFFTI